METGTALEEFVGKLATKAVRTQGTRDRLRQDRVWTDAGGVEHVVASMERRHAANVVRFLEARAQQLLDGECAEWFFLPEPNGEQAAYNVEDERYRLHAAEPLAWLHDQPLVRALVERAAGSKGGPSRRWLLRHPVKAARRLLR